MRVCVYGAGAIGGHLAIRLAKGGAEVSVIARGKHLAAIQARGLEVHAVDGVHKIAVQATDDPRAIGPVDAVFVTVKAPALPAVAEGIGPLLKQDTAVPFVMNGIPWWYFLHLGGPHDGRKLPRVDPGDVLLKTVGPDRAVGGVVYSASAVISPAVIEVEQPKSRVILGEPNGTLSPRVAALADLITKGGISGEATTEIRTEIWNKLISNLAGGTVAVLTGVAPKTAYTEQAAKDASLRVMNEAAAIAQALGARPGTNHEGRLKMQSSMDHKPSILQDLELGRPMEVDGLFDAPLVLARIASVETPTLDLLVALCKLRAQASGLYGR
jgi:2-dehydropantoate 2-reductase